MDEWMGSGSGTKSVQAPVGKPQLYCVVPEWGDEVFRKRVMKKDGR